MNKHNTTHSKFDLALIILIIALCLFCVFLFIIGRLPIEVLLAVIPFSLLFYLITRFLIQFYEQASWVALGFLIAVIAFVFYYSIVMYPKQQEKEYNRPFGYKEFGILLGSAKYKDWLIKESIQDFKSCFNDTFFTQRTKYVSRENTLSLKILKKEDLDSLRKHPEKAIERFINPSLLLSIEHADRDTIATLIFLLKEQLLKNYKSPQRIAESVLTFPTSVMKNIQIFFEFSDGLQFLEKNDFDNAKKILEKVSSEEIGASTGNNALGTLFIKKAAFFDKGSNERNNLINEAEEKLEQSIQQDSFNHSSYFQLGWIKCVEKDSPQEAVTNFLKAVELQPDNYKYVWDLAQAYYFSGRRTRAIEVLENFLSKYGSQINGIEKMEMEKILERYKQK